MKITIFKQTIAVNSLYPLKTQWELFLKFIDKNSIYFIIISCIILVFLILWLVLALKHSLVIESGMMRNFLIEGV